VQGTELSFQTLALDRRLSETLAEVVLRAVASPVTTVTDYGDDHLLVGLVISKHLLEALSKSVEITVPGGPGLKDAGFELC